MNSVCRFHTIVHVKTFGLNYRETVNLAMSLVIYFSCSTYPIVGVTQISYDDTRQKFTISRKIKLVTGNHFLKQARLSGSGRTIMVIKTQKMQVTFLGRDEGEQYFMTVSQPQRKMDEPAKSTYRNWWL